METQTLKTSSEVVGWFSFHPKILAMDTETTSLNYLELELVGMSFADDKHACYIDYWSMDETDRVQTINFLCVYLTECVDLLIFHNAPFDLKVCHKVGLEITEDIFCSMTAAHLIDETGPKGLKDLAQTVLKIPAEEIKRYDEAAEAGYTSEEFYRYAVNDAVWTYGLYRRFDQLLRRQELSKLFYAEEMPFQFVLRDLEINGLRVDQDLLAKWGTEAAATHRQLFRKLYDIGGIGYGLQYNMFEPEPELVSGTNLNNSQKCAEVIEKLGFEITETTEGGEKSADKYALKRLAGKHEFIDTLAEYRKYERLRSSILDKWPGMIDADGRIRPYFNNTVAVTGRLTSNMQQMAKKGTLPLEPRQLIVAEPGKILVVADYAGQELRILAHVSQDKGMIAAFKEGKDLHLSTANSFYKLGIPDACLVESHPEYEGYKSKFKKERDNAKIINFGIAYGKGPVGFAADFGVSLEEAEKIVEAYFRACPDVHRAIDRCRQQARKRGFVSNIVGRRRRFRRDAQYTKRASRQAFNFLIQSVGAELVKISMARVRKRLEEHPEWEAKLVLTVHDEFVIECLEEYKDEVAEVVKYEMESAMKLSVPLVAEPSFGYTYGDAK